MPKFTLDRSVFVSAPPDSVYATVRDFKQWPAWSPWALAEPDCPISFSADGKKYEWDGKIIGNGNIVVESDTPGTEIAYTLTFLKPWKSVADVKFLFKPKDSGTELHWTMDSSLPFFLFWMKGMMTAGLGRDFDRGLSMIKDLVETGAVRSSLSFPGTRPVASFKYIGFKRTCLMAEIGPSISKAFAELEGWREQNVTEATGPALVFYDKFQMTQGIVDYTAAIPVATLAADLPSSLTSGEVPSHDTYPIEHVGPYRHLGNAWAAGMMRAQAKIFKRNKAIPPYEVYNQWTETPEPARLTTVHFPVK